uniref:Uncharacterized protein n=1 Tax=Oryza nivara TaxID=4536 RepID=A0A0E0IFR6_ORYNI
MAMTMATRRRRGKMTVGERVSSSLSLVAGQPSDIVPEEGEPSDEGIVARHVDEADAESAPTCLDLCRLLFLFCPSDGAVFLKNIYIHYNADTHNTRTLPL